MKNIKHEDIYHAHDFGIADTRTHDAVDSIKSPSDKENLEVRNEDNDISNPNTDICVSLLMKKNTGCLMKI